MPQPDANSLREYAGQVLDWSLRHWESLDDQAIGLTASRAKMEALLRSPPPEQSRPLAEVLGEFQEKIAAYAFRVNHPRFLAFVPSAPSYASLLGDWLCAATNFFAGVWLEAAGPAQVEILVLDWFKQFLGYPPEASGLLTGGGSEANLTALVVARERLALEDRQLAVLFVTQHRHWSIDRAAKVLGLHPSQLHPVPATPDFRLDAAALAEAVGGERRGGRVPWAVVANAGATNTGTVDPLDALAKVCAQNRLWLHVDAAYGWPAVLTPAGRLALAGIERADSITLDPHKWFAQTFEAGCLLVREGGRLADTFAMRPDYMQDVAPAHDEVNFADQGIALTRRFRALKIWFSLQLLGLDWFRGLVERCCRLATYAEARLRALPNFQIVSPRQLSIVAFRHVPLRGTLVENGVDAHNLQLVEHLLATGRAFISSTRLDGRVALRFCFVNWRTTAADVDEVIDLLQQSATGGASDP